VLLPLGMNDGGYDVEYRGFPFQTMYPVRNKSQNFTTGTSGPLIFKGLYAPSSYGAGGMFLSLSDLVTWTKALDEETMIKRETLERAIKPTGTAGGFSQMGWAIQNNNGVKIAGHSGGPGLADVLRVSKDNLTIIVLTNNSDLYAYMAPEILKLYYPQISPEKMPKTFKRNLVR
jgi:CubicO group peptidase (beta-lactamase class C family)